MFARLDDDKIYIPLPVSTQKIRAAMLAFSTLTSRLAYVSVKGYRGPDTSGNECFGADAKVNQKRIGRRYIWFVADEGEEAYRYNPAKAYRGEIVIS